MAILELFKCSLLLISLSMCQSSNLNSSKRKTKNLEKPRKKRERRRVLPEFKLSSSNAKHDEYSGRHPSLEISQSSNSDLNGESTFEAEAYEKIDWRKPRTTSIKDKLRIRTMKTRFNRPIKELNRFVLTRRLAPNLNHEKLLTYEFFDPSNLVFTWIQIAFTFDENQKWLETKCTYEFGDSEQQLEDLCVPGQRHIYHCNIKDVLQGAEPMITTQKSHSLCHGLAPGSVYFYLIPDGMK